MGESISICIEPFQAGAVRLIFRLAVEGDRTSGPIVIRSITKPLNAAGIGYDRGRLDAAHSPQANADRGAAVFAAIIFVTAPTGDRFPMSGSSSCNRQESKTSSA